MRYLGQIFIDAGLLAVPAMTQVRMAEASFQLNMTAFEPSHYPTASNQQPSLVQPLIADLAQVTQSNQADSQKTQITEQRNKATV